MSRLGSEEVQPYRSGGLGVRRSATVGVIARIDERRELQVVSTVGRIWKGLLDGKGRDVIS
jgi:hypothetical protein